jgi:hypothetical protein
MSTMLFSRGFRYALVVAVCLAAQIGLPRPGVSQQTGAGTAPDTLIATEISPRAALLRSMAVPGWGQAYAGSPGRGAVYFALGSGAFWMTLKTHRQLSASREHDRWLRETGQLPERQLSPLTRSRAQQFEDWVTLALVTLAFSGVDAYVVAQLVDVVEQVDVRPGAGGGLQFRAGFGVGAGR